MHRLKFSSFAVFLLAMFSAVELFAAAPEKVDFARDIQPVLSQKCLSCHGTRKQEGHLRWDNKESALTGGEHGPNVVIGNSAKSRVIELLVTTNSDDVMPQKGDPLTTEQIAQFRAWIDQGAQWPASASVQVSDPKNHWAFKAPVRPPLPVVKNKKWARNPIDNFVLARLDEEKLAPSPEADRPTLLRRASLDLTGLPPTIREIEDFIADRKPGAYDRQVERLLASPHYGECWARHWLDAAHYADSNGYEKDLTRSIWPYRDWVINAYNGNMPFDQFAIDQLAGDMLPNSTIADKVATGFLRNSMLNEEGGIDPEQFRIQGIIERMDVMGKAFLGLTVNCCQCHNHKFDPISQKEYYQLFAFLNNDDEPLMEVPDKDTEAERETMKKKIAEMEDDLLAKNSGVANKLADWEKKMTALPREWTVLDPFAFYGSVGTKFNKLEDKSLLATGSSPPISEYTITCKTTLKGITAFRVEALTDPNLPFNGPGRAKNGNFVLTEFMVQVGTNEIHLTNATADYSQSNFPPAAAMNGVETNKTGWAVGDLPGRANQDRQIVFETQSPIGDGNEITLKFILNQTLGEEHTLGRFRISATTGDQPVQADPLTASARHTLSVSPAQRTPSEKRELFGFYRLTDPQFADATKKIDDEQSKWPAAPTTLVLAAKPEPRQTHVFIRGDWQSQGALVTPGVPSILNSLPADAPLNRLTLAKWMVDKRNPTVARVIVNRIWQSYFGRGIVETVEDFGTQGDKPTHPQLLDWLAVEFMESGWDVKHIQRLIADSATYRQSSVISPAMWERDQYNTLLARGPRARVDAEIIRDIALSASGLLEEKIGGPSVYPPIPDGVMALGYGSPMPWETKKKDRYRRAMYTFAKRSVPYPSLQVFDAPTGETPCPRRVRSNTPVQALTTLNDPVYVEAAQAMALRVWKQGGNSDRSRIDYAFELCTGRKPRSSEVAVVSSLLHDEKAVFENSTARAVQVASPNPTNPPPDVNLHKVAEWTMVSRVLLNMDETITKE